MQSSIEARMSTFEDTIEQVVKKYKLSDSRVEYNGLSRDDFISILRVTVWKVLTSKDSPSRSYVCASIWNRAKDLLRISKRERHHQRIIISHEDHEPYQFDLGLCDSRFSLQKLVDGLCLEDLRVLSITFEKGNQQAAKDLDISKATLQRKLRLVKDKARSILNEEGRK